jgi:hypothetical protein
MEGARLAHRSLGEGGREEASHTEAVGLGWRNLAPSEEEGEEPAMS